MFSSGPNYTKLKTNLRLAVSRLKLLEKKKMELAQKSRKEIADYISGGKVERAKIRVEHIIREDYMVEAMEMLEMYCDLLLARMGLIQQMKTVDGGLEEAVSTILWAGPRMLADVPELKVICDQLSVKYGKDYADACRDDTKPSISAKFKHRMGVQAPPKLLVEKYLIEISNNFNVAYEPDENILKGGDTEGLLIDLGDQNKLGGGGAPAMNIVDPPGFKGFPAPPMLPSDFQPFNYKYPGDGKSSTSIGGFVVPPGSSSSSTTNTKAGTGYGVPFSYNIPVDDNVSKPINYPRTFEERPPSYDSINNVTDTTDGNNQDTSQPKPTPKPKISPPEIAKPKTSDSLFPELPSVPDDTPHLSSEDILAKGNQDEDDIDFDDLTKRFENLKKKK
ncbi:UNVERIFIED_CONTAM: hypothetical protein PYX00_009493 [Menopon gallinae]|uniref:IST1 homolog n=1 Tax=Menopon gallinae TaxID=328185 RepID=A0AAW2HBK8_9NEOP